MRLASLILNAIAGAFQKGRAASASTAEVAPPRELFAIYSPIWLGRPRSRRLRASTNKYAWTGQYRRVAVITRQLKRASARNRQHLMRHAA